MIFQKYDIGQVFHVTIYHYTISLDFEDYDNFFLKVRGKKPKYEVYTSSQEKGRDYMLGFDFYWDDGTVERMSFKDFWHYFDRNWDWDDKSETLGKYPDRYKILNLKYTEVIFQTHNHGACAFNRITDRVTGYTQDLDKAKEYIKNFNKSCIDYKNSGTWMKIS